MAISLTSSGIVYTGTQSPAQASGSGAAYTLDDYEEGTYTPAFSMLTVDSIYLAGYTKIGNFVFCQFYGEFTGGGSANAVHTAGPFTCVTAGYSPGSLDYAAANANHTNPHVRSESNSSSVSFLKNQVAAIIASDIDGGHVIWSLGYRTA